MCLFRPFLLGGNGVGDRDGVGLSPACQTHTTTELHLTHTLDLFNQCFYVWLVGVSFPGIQSITPPTLSEF